MMNPIRILFSLLAAACFVAALATLVLTLASAPVPSEMTAAWRYIPSLGMGLLGQALALLAGGALSQVLYRVTATAEDPRWVEVHRW